MARLSNQPEGGVETLAELIGVAGAIEDEAVDRYRWLVAEMRRRGEEETARAFEALLAEERSHVVDVARWAEGLGAAVPGSARFRWRLPDDLASSWEEVARSALLTPYRAYSIAVQNEERAFAFYAYLAAAAADDRIAREAERLADQELRHAAALRVWRRAAWRRERGPDGPARRPEVATLAELEQLIAAHEREIAVCHGSLATRFRKLGDDATAGLLSEAGAACEPGVCTAPECTADNALELLMAAQRPLERMAEELEAVLIAAPDEAMRALSEAALTRAVERIARLGRRLEELERG